MNNLLLNELSEWLHALIRYTPGQIGFWARKRLLRISGLTFAENTGFNVGFFVSNTKNVHLGKNISFGRDCCLESNQGLITINDNCAFNHNVYLAADYGKIIIEEGVLIGPNTFIRSADHETEGNKPIRNSGHKKGTVLIGKNVWIGANVTIISGANIGDGAIIAAGSVVRGTIPPFTLAAGIPAVVKKHRINQT